LVKGTVIMSIVSTAISFPSVIFPGPPAFTIDAPDGWQPVVTPDALVALRDPRGGGFQANLVVTCERFPASTTAAGLAANVDTDRRDRLVNYGSTDVEPIEHAAGPAAMFRSAFTIAANGDGFDVAQWTAFIECDPFEGVRYITAITASGARTDAAALEPAMIEAIASLRFM
jgi:hypothetical protein